MEITKFASMSTMNIGPLSPKNVEGKGYEVPLYATDPRHYGQFVNAPRDTSNDLVGEFGSMVKNAIDRVNTKQARADHLIIQAGISPDSVDVHTVTTAVAEAELAMNLTKAVTERVIRAYQELMNLR